MRPMLTPHRVAIHWPFIREHLSLSRQPALLRVLDELTEQQAWFPPYGEPVAMRRLLLARGRTKGEVGNAWRALVDLERRGVVCRHHAGGRRSGRRPDLWSLVPHAFGTRWRVPWERSGRRIEAIVVGCDCVARSDSLIARFPGQSVPLYRDGAAFSLPPQAHQGLWCLDRDTSASDRAITSPVTRENAPSARDKPRASHLSSLGSTPSSYGEDDDELSTALKEAVLQATGSPVFGAPLHVLKAVAQGCREGELEAFLREIRHTQGVKAPKVIADLAPGMLAQVRQRAAVLAHDRARAEARREETEGARELVDQHQGLRNAKQALGNLVDGA